MSKSQVQKSVKITARGTVETTTSDIPQLKEDEVLVRVACVAINPVDGKSADLSPTPGATLGFDYSGEVVALGTQAVEGVTRPLGIGDRVFGCVFGNNPDRPDNGSFAEYVAVPANLALLVPSQMSFEEAATLGVGLATVGLALYQSLRLPIPLDGISLDGAEASTGPRHVLVYGGSTATGMLAIQMIKQYVIQQTLQDAVPFQTVDQTLTGISAGSQLRLHPYRNLLARKSGLPSVSWCDCCVRLPLAHLWQPNSRLHRQQIVLRPRLHHRHIVDAHMLRGSLAGGWEICQPRSISHSRPYPTQCASKLGSHLDHIWSAHQLEAPFSAGCSAS